ncbi:hypothetical protein PMAYCL1PPCAC_17121 [Pristionchus mayeri]|uniref:Nuclear receptor n=1 Tax=Pristionchus mayeri TaxID=1317129 RepID=A0AAN5CM10_9BILA|nr:hypothetical protein PMAYCL1PPCAC_17121 [Pristionchus mayeri]
MCSISNGVSAGPSKYSAVSAMPQKGVSKKKDRTCLICCGPTRVAFLGIDVCRACSVFYKRNEQRNEFTCRASTRDCPIGEELNCKRCRFDHIERLLKQSSASSHAVSSPSDQSPDASQSPQRLLQSSSPSTSSNGSHRNELPILDRLKTHYRSMSWMRLNSELQCLPNPPHPCEISLESGPYFPATFASLTTSNRTLMTALLDFGCCVFPELSYLQNKEKWDIVVNNFYRFRLFEGIYRACLFFPDDLNRTFGGYSTWVSATCLPSFCSDAPTGDREGLENYFDRNSTRMQEIPQARSLVHRVNPSHEEFLFIVALMFWTFGDMPVRDEITHLGERYRDAILKELHAFYREERRMEDYAARLGELMILLPVFDRSHEIKEHFEMLRLLDIIPEDCFTYQLQKAE